jgi:hypothetical protein
MKTPIVEGFTEAGLVSYLRDRQYNELYWPLFFPLVNVNTLDGKTLIGEQGSRIAAHIISYDAKAPEASRKKMTTQHFDIPKIAVSRRKTEKEILEHTITRAFRGNDAVLEDYFADADYVFDAVNARMEWMALTALSTGSIQLTASNNPMGIVNETVVDFGLPTKNKKFVSVVWSEANAATMKPISDFKKVVKAARDMGFRIGRALMHPDQLDYIIGSTEFQDSAKSFLLGQTQVLGYIGLDTVNAIFKALGIPEISIIETSIGIAGKDGIATETNPWSSTHVLFVPQPAVGGFFNGPIAEEIEKPENVVQAKRSNVLISVKKDFDPVSVLTKGEANCFPSWPTVDKCISLYTNSASAWA